MNINDYKYITTIAETGSFTSAAKELFIAQPSLSQRVRYIESEYGIHIFVRNAKGISLTPEGECFVNHATQILRSEQELREEIEAMHNLDNRMLKIASSTQLTSSYLFQQLLIRFNDLHPNIKLDIVNQNSLISQELLLGAKVDIAIIYLPINSPELTYRILYPDRYILIPAFGSELEKILRQSQDPKKPVDVSLLNQIPFATATPGTVLHSYIIGLQKRHDITLDIRHFGKNYAVLYSMADAGVASTIVLESLFEPGSIKTPYYYLEDTDDTLSIAVVWRKHSHLSAYAKDFTEIAEDIRSSYAS